jgi:hypothetical protein
MNAILVGALAVVAVTACATVEVASSHGKASETPSPRKTVRRDSLVESRFDIVNAPIPEW